MIVVTTCATCGAEIRSEVQTQLAARIAERRNVCDSCGAKQRAEWDAQHQQREQQGRQERHQRHLSASGMPKALIGAARPSGPPDAAIRAWVADGGILTLWGDRGRGKTTSAARALVELARRRPVYWRTAMSLARDLRADYGSQTREIADWIARGHSALVLDDLAKINDRHRDAQATIAEVIDAHYSHGSPLLVTCTVHPDTLADAWPDTGEDVASRLASGEIVHVAGPDHRRASRTTRTTRG